MGSLSYFLTGLKSTFTISSIMQKIASSSDIMKAHYEVVVIGSGYGGGVAASRLARAGRSVCLLERGREFMPGEFPQTLPEATAQMQLDTPSAKLGSATGLYNFHVNNQISVLVGCGLGGTSLINANVALKAEPRVFANGKWPTALLADQQEGLAAGYARAAEMLVPKVYPDHYPPLDKLKAHQRSGAALGRPFYKTPINVNFVDQTNHVGVAQKACVNCGDCVSGCNYTAKNTTQMNYLPDAWNHGAEIFTECHVDHLAKAGDKWLVYYTPVGIGCHKFDAPLLFVSAGIVVLSAGTLGSTEIMLRSRQQGLPLSPMLGQRFSGNGDVLGFGYDCDQKINGIGFGKHDPATMEPCGPCITSVIDTRETCDDYLDGLIIEEGSIPGALASTLPGAFASIAQCLGDHTGHGLVRDLREAGGDALSLVQGSYHGPVQRTQTYLIMSQDDDSGVIDLNAHDKLEIDWQGVGHEQVFMKANAALDQCTDALNGTYIKDPIWTKAFNQELISVHPLGGCIMGNDVHLGVVNHKGQVFDPSGNEVYLGLYIADGSVIPTTLGVNPLYTITAISERNMALLALDYGWAIDYTLPSAPRQAVPTTPGIRFTETMRGYFSTHDLTDYQQGYAAGQQENSLFVFTLTIEADNVARLMQEPLHAAALSGTVLMPALSPEPMTASAGTFNLFVDYAAKVNTKRMLYGIPLRDVAGTAYYVAGYKEINEDHGLRVWAETSTLYITVHQGADTTGSVLGKGILHIAPTDFLKQMTTLAAINTSSVKEKLATELAFGEFFAGALYATYGNILRKDAYFNPDAPARQKRPLRAPAPEVHYFKTPDDVTLRLTRYQGGQYGPVICSHGLGVASSIFSTDLIDTNLLEYLVAHEYDVWLLDYRVSIDLPAAQQQSTGDDVARYDYPAAVETVRTLTGAPDVQMVVHCYGSATWTMAMLNGLPGVRSAVCSQVAAHMKAPLLTRVKAGLHLPGLLDHLGIKSLSAYVDSKANWANKLYDKALEINPLPYHEGCHNPVCHRITFMYSELYQHEQLNQATHDNLHELFGSGNITSFEHLADMVRRGIVADYHGGNVYLPHPERLAIPILFLSGEDNKCYLPESTELTYEYLCQANGDELYKRQVIAGYGHIDCIFGANAIHDVFPLILDHLEQTKQAVAVHS
jgi:cholesterol oxidase